MGIEDVFFKDWCDGIVCLGRDVMCLMDFCGGKGKGMAGKKKKGICGRGVLGWVLESMKVADISRLSIS